MKKKNLTWGFIFIIVDTLCAWVVLIRDSHLSIKMQPPRLISAHLEHFAVVLEAEDPKFH